MAVPHDTQVLLWAAKGSSALSDRSGPILTDPGNEFCRLSGGDRHQIRPWPRRFEVESTAIRERALLAGYQELTVRGSHALGISMLPAIHTDPFDRMLLARLGPSK